MQINAAQHKFLSFEEKFRAYVGGFGSGKTWIGCTDLALFAGANPNALQGYFAPTYRDIRDTFWPTMTECAESLGFRVVIRKADKEVHLFRGKVYYGGIICRSMDDPGGIVGFKIARGLVDEIDILPIDKATAAWRKIIGRLRLNLPGVVNGLGLTTTPEGFKFTHATFSKPHIGFAMVQASTYENEPHLPPDYIPSLRDQYPAELIDAYLDGRFVNLTSGTVYRSYDREKNRSTETIQPREALHIGQDFNVGNMFSAVNVDRADGWHVVDEISGGFDTPSTIRTIKDRFDGYKIYIYPDASGTGRKTVDASKSDIRLLREAGFHVKHRSTNPRVKDRILSVNRALETQRLWVNDKSAPTLADALEQQVYAKNGEPDKQSNTDHPNDAQGYFVNFVMPVIKPEARQQALVI